MTGGAAEREASAYRPHSPGRASHAQLSDRPGVTPGPTTHNPRQNGDARIFGDRVYIRGERQTMRERVQNNCKDSENKDVFFVT